MGAARIVDRNTVEVTSSEGKQSVSCDDIVVATGSVPIEIPGFAFDEDAVWSSTGALAPKEIPGHLVVIGGGYIGLELGMMYRHLGSQVTVLEATGGALPGQDRDCVKVIERSLKKQKIKLMTETFAKEYRREGDGLVVTVERGGKREEVACDQVLSTVGRRPYSEGLGLENLGLSTTDRGFLAVDKQMRTAVPNVYAIGDIAGQPMLAHKGSKEGLVAAAVIAGQAEEYDALRPRGDLHRPEMASVSMTEDPAQGRYQPVPGSPVAASGAPSAAGDRRLRQDRRRQGDRPRPWPPHGGPGGDRARRRGCARHRAGGHHGGPGALIHAHRAPEAVMGPRRPSTRWPSTSSSAEPCSPTTRTCPSPGHAPGAQGLRGDPRLQQELVEKRLAEEIMTR